MSYILNTENLTLIHWRLLKSIDAESPIVIFFGDTMVQLNLYTCKYELSLMRWIWVSVALKYVSFDAQCRVTQTTEE